MLLFLLPPEAPVIARTQAFPRRERNFLANLLLGPNFITDSIEIQTARGFFRPRLQTEISEAFRPDNLAAGQRLEEENAARMGKDSALVRQRTR